MFPGTSIDLAAEPTPLTLLMQHTFEFDSLTTGTGSLVKEGNGFFALAFARPNYHGNIVINAGVVTANTATRVGINDGTVTINSNSNIYLGTTGGALTIDKTLF